MRKVPAVFRVRDEVFYLASTWAPRRNLGLHLAVDRPTNGACHANTIEISVTGTRRLYGTRGCLLPSPAENRIPSQHSTSCSNNPSVGFGLAEFELIWFSSQLPLAEGHAGSENLSPTGGGWERASLVTGAAVAVLSGAGPRFGLSKLEVTWVAPRAL